MPAPAPSWSTVRVHGTWVNQDGSLKAGTYEVKIPVRVTNATDDVIIPAGTFAKGTLNTTNGLPSLDLQIPATDDPDNLPNFQVQITVTFPDALGEQYQIDVPIALQDDVNGIDLRAVVLASTFTPTAALIRGVPGGIAGLDAGGRVVDADGNVITAPDLSGYTTTTDFTAGLSNKVNTSTYTSGLAAKADTAALTAYAPRGNLTALGLGPVVSVGSTVGFDYNTANYASHDLAVQAAVNSLPSSGGVVMLSGDFDFVNGVDCSAKARVRIDGGFAARIRWKNSNTFANTTPGANYLLTLGQYAQVIGIRLDGQSNFTCPINGVDTQTAAGTNTLGSGIKTTSFRTRLEAVYVANMAEDGISNQGAGSLKCSDVYVINCGGRGVHLTNVLGSGGKAGTDADLTSLFIGSCGTGMQCDTNAISLTIPHIWGCQGDGLYINGVTAGAVRCAGGYIETNGGWGIHLDNVNNCTFTGVDIWSNGLAYTPANPKGGVLLTTSNGNMFLGCIFRDNAYYQMQVDTQSSNNIVLGNTFVDSFARTRGANTVVSYTAGGTLTAGSTTFTDSNNPAWMVTTPAPQGSRAIGKTLSITGAGSGGGTLVTQVVAWTQPSPGVYSLTLADPIATTVTNPTYTVNAVAYVIRETGAGTSTANQYLDNLIRVGTYAISSLVTQVHASGTHSSLYNNMGLNPQAWYEGGTVSGTVSVDIRNGAYYHATLGGSITNLTITGSSVRAGQQLTIMLTQDGTGGRAVSGWGSNVKWSTAGAPTWPPAAGATAIVAFQYDGTNWIEQSRSEQAAGTGTGTGTTPSTRWGSSDQSLHSWNFEPTAIVSTTISTAGLLQLAKARIIRGTTLSTLWLNVTVAGAGLTTGQCFAALYDSAGNRLGVTSDQATAWGTTGTKAAALTSAVTVDDDYVYVGWYWTGTTGPSFARGANNSAVNAGMSGGYRFATANSGLTTSPPTTLGTASSATVAYWVAVS